MQLCIAKPLPTFLLFQFGVVFWCGGSPAMLRYLGICGGQRQTLEALSPVVGRALLTPLGALPFPYVLDAATTHC